MIIQNIEYDPARRWICIVKAQKMKYLILLASICFLLAKNVIGQGFLNEDALFINNYKKYVLENHVRQIDVVTETFVRKKRIAETRALLFDNEGFYIGFAKSYNSTEFNNKQIGDTFKFNKGCHGYYDCDCFNSYLKLECNNEGEMTFYKDYLGVQKIVYDDRKRIDSIFNRFFIPERPDSFSVSKVCYTNTGNVSKMLTFKRNPASKLPYDTIDYFKNILLELVSEKKIVYAGNKINQITETTLNGTKKRIDFSYHFFYDKKGMLVKIVSRDAYNDEVTIFVKYKFW